MKPRSPVIAIIGAGSFSHGKRLIDDLLSVDALQASEIRLMAPHMDNLRVVSQYAARVVDFNHFTVRFVSTTDRTEALQNADYVIGLFDVGGFPAFDADYRVACNYGLDLCIGDSSGPTGIMKALRNAAVLRELAADINRLCPNALYLSYTNPMAVTVMAADAFGLRRVVGLCGGAEATRRTIAACLGCKPGELEVDFAGINHMCWALSIRKDGEDLYTQFRRKLAEPAFLTSERVRFEVMQQFGYFVTETSGHLSDFFPWFRRDASLLRRYCSVEGYSGAKGAFHKYARFVQSQIGQLDYLEFEEGKLPRRSDDYSARIIESLETGSSYRFIGNVMNRDQRIPNLPNDCCVEIPVETGAIGLAAPQSDPLPPQLAALAMTNIVSQRLTLDAIMSNDPELVFAAIAVDPLTSATLDLPQMREMTGRLLSANSRFIPEMAGKGLRETTAVKESYTEEPALDGRDSLFEMIREFHRKRQIRQEADPKPNPGSRPRNQ